MFTLNFIFLHIYPSFSFMYYSILFMALFLDACGARASFSGLLYMLRMNVLLFFFLSFFLLCAVVADTWPPSPAGPNRLYSYLSSSMLSSSPSKPQDPLPSPTPTMALALTLSPTLSTATFRLGRIMRYLYYLSFSRKSMHDSSPFTRICTPCIYGVYR